VFFIRVLRPMSLIFIVCGMVGLKHYLQQHFQTISKVQPSEFTFWLLVISVLLITSGGSIINDYFDVRTDRVNRPLRVIVDKQLKKRWAIIFHWTFNCLAFCIAVYLSWYYRTLTFVIVHTIAILLLWNYSIAWKKKTFIGNISVPFLIVLLTFVTIQWAKLDMSIKGDYMQILIDKIFDVPIVFVIISYMQIIFLQMIARDLFKNIENIRGDIANNNHTLVVVLGIEHSKKIIRFIIILPPIMYLCFLLLGHFLSLSINWTKIWAISLITLINIGIYISLKQKKYIVSVNNLKLFTEIAIILMIVHLFISS